MCPSPPNTLSPSKADNTTCPIESPADVFAKTDTKLPSIFYELSEKSFRWVKQTDEAIIIVNPNTKYRRIQNKIKQHLIRLAPPSKYSLHGISGGFKRLSRLRGFYDLFVVDLSRAYESVTFTRVTGLLRSRGFDTPERYAKYCIFNGTLMRGSTCSNQILESLLIRLDYRLAGLSAKQMFKMKRYTDEYWFYGDFQGKNLRQFLFDVSKAVHDEGFRLNESKTYVERQTDFATMAGHWQ
jgi:hypothetical protein